MILVNERTLEKVENIKKRYFVNNQCLIHHMDCDIFRAEKQFCSCGLLHDLMALSSSQLCVALYPNYEKDMITQEGIDENNNKLKTLQILEEIFGKLTEEDSKDYLETEIKILRKVFNTSPNALMTFICNLKKTYEK